MVLKPSEKTPLTALALADILYEAGLPPEMLSVITGDPAEIADELLTSSDVDLVTFTGGVRVGKYIAAKAIYKRQVLELGGNARGQWLVEEFGPALHRGQVRRSIRFQHGHGYGYR
jgi:aldehyde dehydrogenase (NAD+)